MHCTSCGSLLPPGSLGTTICPTCGASNFVPLSSPAQSEPASPAGEAQAMAEPAVFQETVSSPRPQQPPRPQQAEWIAPSFDAFSSPTADIDKRTTGYGPAYQFSEADAPTGLSARTCTISAHAHAHACAIFIADAIVAGTTTAAGAYAA